MISTPAFVRTAKRYVKRHPEAAAVLRDVLVQLELDAFSPGLRTHKLRGDLAGCWSCSGGYDLRIVFAFARQDDGEAIRLLAVGTHNDVY